jgi:tetratricopeptide (TPR) repeat protein
VGNLLEAQEYYLDYAVNNPDGKHWGEAILGLAEISESLDRAPVALKFYQDLVTRGEKNQFGTTAIKRMADIYYRIGRYSEGVDLYRQLANNDTSSEIQLDYTIKVIIGLYRQGLMESAQSEVTAFTKKYKKSPQLPNCQAIFLLEKAKAQAKEKNFNEALTTLQLVSTKYPKSTILPEVEYEIGKIQLITNHFEEALGILSNMPNKYPNHEILPSVYLTLGTYYYRQSDFQNALLSFQEVLDNTQGRDLWPTALKNLELTYKDLGLYEAALSIVNRYLELFPYSEDALLKRLDAAQILLQLRDYDRAIQRLQDLLPLASQEMRVEAQFYLGEAYFQKGDFSQAVLEYMKVKYLDPGGGLDWAVTAIYNAGICYEKLGKLEEAKKMYQDIISRWGVNSDYGKGAKKRIDFLEQLKK